MSIQCHYSTESEEMSTGVVQEVPSAVCGETPGQPPSCNTGVECTEGIKIDYLRYTLSSQDKNEKELIEGVVEILGPDKEWAFLPKGLYGYKQSMKCGGIRILFDGQYGMGVCVQISGQGCRELEGSGAIAGDWIGFLAFLKALGVNFTRLDVAIDDLSGKLHLHQVREWIDKRQVVSRLGNYEDRVSGSIHQEEKLQGRTITFGSMHSLRKVRIYDKAAEQNLPTEHWVRVELESKDEYAAALVNELIAQGIEAVPRVLYGILDFKEENPSDSNMRRWNTCDWWLDFLGFALKQRLQIAPVVRTMEKLYQWVEGQVAPSLALICNYWSHGELLKIAERGRSRLGSRHWALMHG